MAAGRTDCEGRISMTLSLQHTRAAVVPATVNESARTVEVTFSTGAEVTRSDWRTGGNYVEALSMDPKHIRLGRLNTGAPLLDSHRAGGVGSVIGVVESARVEGGTGVALLRFSERDDVTPIFNDVKAGVLRNISVGYLVHRWDVEAATKEKPERKTAVDWEPYEISLVAIPADPTAQTRSMPGQEQNMTQVQQNEQVLAERQRVALIDQLCSMHGIDSGRRGAWIADGADVEDVKAAILAIRARVQQDTMIHVGGHGGESSMLRDASDALVRRAGERVEGDGHRQFGDARLMDIAKRVLERGGVNTRTLSGNEIATRALSTSDFANILGLAGQRIVRNAYDAVELCHRTIFRRTTASDFRAKHSVSNASAGILPEVTEGAPYPRTSVSAEKASYALKTYGSIIPFTRQLLINDDFGLVESAARQRGRSAAETERKVVWGFILGNPTAADGVSTFDLANHKNYPAASATPIGSATLAAARTALRTALSPDGFPTNGLLKHVVVAPGGEVDFDQLLNGVYVPGAAGTAMTERLRNVQLHVEPLLSSSKSDWMGFTDYGQCDHFEYAYLSGSEGPRVEQRTNFETDALELKCVLDFGIGAIDWRGAYYQRQS